MAGGEGAARPALMVTPSQARAEARRRMGSSHRKWTLEGWSPPVWVLGLKPPTERQALGDQGTAQAWVRSWRAVELPEGVRVDWDERSWRSLGTQRVPMRVVVESPDALARWCGGQTARELRVFADRVDQLRGMARPQVTAAREESHAGLSAALRRHAQRLTDLPAPEFERLAQVLDWLGSHSVAGLRPRQLPIRGVDSKWFSAHRAVLSALHAELFPEAGEPGLGILDTHPTVRLRVLDPALRPAGLRDLDVPLDQAAALDWSPELVVIVENSETLLCLPQARGVVGIWGKGFNAQAATALPWLVEVPILYWGDLDSQGFAILHRYRSHLPQIRSILMDEPTLEQFRDLWVLEPTPFRGSLSTLTPAETRTLERLRAEGDVRLEQERVAWAYAVDELARHLPAFKDEPACR